MTVLIFIFSFVQLTESVNRTITVLVLELSVSWTNDYEYENCHKRKRYIYLNSSNLFSSLVLQSGKALLHSCEMYTNYVENISACSEVVCECDILLCIVLLTHIIRRAVVATHFMCRPCASDSTTMWNILNTICVPNTFHSYVMVISPILFVLYSLRKSHVYIERIWLTRSLARLDKVHLIHLYTVASAVGHECVRCGCKHEHKIIICTIKWRTLL